MLLRTGPGPQTGGPGLRPLARGWGTGRGRRRTVSKRVWRSVEFRLLRSEVFQTLIVPFGERLHVRVIVFGSRLLGNEDPRGCVFMKSNSDGNCGAWVEWEHRGLVTRIAEFLGRRSCVGFNWKLEGAEKIPHRTNDTLLRTGLCVPLASRPRRLRDSESTLPPPLRSVVRLALLSRLPGLPVLQQKCPCASRHGCRLVSFPLQRCPCGPCLRDRPHASFRWRKFRYVGQNSASGTYLRQTFLCGVVASPR
jgi:hypothetical protein